MSLLSNLWTSKKDEKWITITTKAEFIKTTKNDEYVQVSFKVEDLLNAIKGKGAKFDVKKAKAKRQQELDDESEDESEDEE